MTPPTRSSARTLAATAALALLGLASACNIGTPAQDDPTRYYVLADPAPTAAAAAAPGGVRLGLRTPALENYLKKRDMVVRSGANEVDFRDYRRWAEPLEGNIARLLRAHLLAAPAVASAAVEPFPIDQDRDYDVAIEVRHCEGATGADGHSFASFAATIEITSAGLNPQVVVRKVFVAPPAGWDGADYARLASLLSADVAALASEILADLPKR